MNTTDRYAKIREALEMEVSAMRELPRDLVTILRTEARNQRTPPIGYVIAEDGGRMVHTHEPDIAMAELLEEAAAALAARDAELVAVKAALSGDAGELIDKMAEAIRDNGKHYDETPWDILSEERKEGWRGDARRALAVVKEYLTARLPASRTVTEEMVEALKRIRDTAMEHTLAARIPECGVFGGIAQDADWLLSELTAAMEAGQ